MSWNEAYAPEERRRMAKGNHRVAITEVEDTVSKSSGKPMLVVHFKTDINDRDYRTYYVQNDYFNANITEFFDKMGIERGNFDFDSWVGKMGGAYFDRDENGYWKLFYLMDRSELDNLPAWEGEVPVSAKSIVDSFMSTINEDGIPDAFADPLL